MAAVALTPCTQANSHLGRLALLSESVPTRQPRPSLCCPASPAPQCRCRSCSCGSGGAAPCPAARRCAQPAPGSAEGDWVRHAVWAGATWARTGRCSRRVWAWSAGYISGVHCSAAGFGLLRRALLPSLSNVVQQAGGEQSLCFCPPCRAAGRPRHRSGSSATATALPPAVMARGGGATEPLLCIAAAASSWNAVN